jgi:microcin C transport system permease protein
MAIISSRINGFFDFKSAFMRFKSNRRAYISLCIFAMIFFISQFAELISNDKPLLLYYKGELLFPVFNDIREIDLGGDYLNSANFNDVYVKELVAANGFAIMPIIPYHYKTIMDNLPSPAPSAPNMDNLLGTDDHGRDILARLIYGVRISITFALTLAVLSTAIGLIYGACQGYIGGKTDIVMQRFSEVWSSLPTLYILIILSSLIAPSFMWLLFIMLLFSWLNLVGVVRAEFLKARNMEYVMAAQALGISHSRIVFRHIMPNALVASITYFPFLINAGITSLTALDFLGLGLPPGDPSLGEMLSQAKNNLHAHWIISSVFITLTGVMVLMIFIGEGLRDALDPRRGGSR